MRTITPHIEAAIRLAKISNGGTPEHYGDYEAALARHADPEKLGLSPVTMDHFATVCDRLGIDIMLHSDPDWPTQLYDLGLDMPHILFIRGNRAALSEPTIGIVGARASTGYGNQVTTDLTHELVNRGYGIVSGGAYGIDGTAHRAAVGLGGKTVAFLAGGVDRYYPAGHDELLHLITRHGGACVSETFPGDAPTKWRFLRRNRLIAAAGQATVVVEAGLRSGSLNTVGWANKIGRPVGAVPGPTTSPASNGTAHAIRTGQATLVTNAEHVIALTKENEQ